MSAGECSFKFISVIS